jgi:NADPH2:quinone reductase
MHAIRQHTFGPAENLRYEEIPDPSPAADQVLIGVEASGVHVIDTSIRAGLTSGPFPLPELPMTPGREVAGRVVAVGPGVEPQWLDRRVVAHLGQASGGYAELAVAPVSALHAVPDHVTAAAAVAMIGTGRTTMGILEVDAPKAGDVVLVTAAAGGIGNLLVQAGVAAGATVVGVAGGQAKLDQVRKLGAAVAVDYTGPDWVAEVRDELSDQEVTLAYDSVGGDRGHELLELLGVGARLVLFGWSSGVPTALTTDDILAGGLTVSALGPRLIRRPGGLRDLVEKAIAAAASGELEPLIGTPFRLRDAAAAHTAIETRATMGKTVLVP